MENKLKLEHIAPYLPFLLKVSNSINVAEFGVCENTIETLEGLLYGNVVTDKDEFGIELCLLHLRPLSDLTKEIEHNGEKFVPRSYFESMGGNYYYYQRFLKTFDKGNITQLSYKAVQKLLEWHFDIFGLIPQNLAIDINTLNK